MTEQRPGFTAAEWDLLRKAAVLAGATVAIGAFSGAGGTEAEFRAIVEGLEAAATRYPGNDLVQGLTTDETRREAEGYVPQFRSNPSQKEVSDFRLAALNRCAQLSELLDARVSPEQAREVKEAIVSMCEHVAQKSKEGGFLGMGGARVDPREVAAIDQVRRTLGL